MRFVLIAHFLTLALFGCATTAPLPRPAARIGTSQAIVYDTGVYRIRDSIITAHHKIDSIWNHLIRHWDEYGNAISFQLAFPVGLGYERSFSPNLAAGGSALFWPTRSLGLGLNVRFSPAQRLLRLFYLQLDVDFLRVDVDESTPMIGVDASGPTSYRYDSTWRMKGYYGSVGLYMVGRSHIGEHFEVLAALGPAYQLGIKLADFTALNAYLSLAAKCSVAYIW